MRATLFLLIAMMAGCGSPDPGNQPPVDTRILVSGSDMGVLFQNINLTRGGFPVTGAEVLVNGTPMVETQSGHYSGQLPDPIGVGGTIQIDVRAGSDTVRGTTAVPAVPTLVAPTSGTMIQLGTPLDFSWTDLSSPDEFRIGILYGATAELASYGSAARSGTVVTSRIPATTTALSAFLYAYGDGTFTGPAHPDSKMRVRQPGGTVNIVPVH